MLMSPAARKLALTAHVATSVGWLGAVIAFLALSVIGLTARDEAVARGVYLVMEPAARYTLVPLAFASLLTGIIQSLGTEWGLFRHYWVLFKLALTMLATLVLVTYMGTFRAMAQSAADAATPLAIVRNPSPVVHAVLALLVLLATTVLAIYKPRGVTPYGWRSSSRR